MPETDVAKPVIEVTEVPPSPPETHEVETAPPPVATLSAEDQLAARIKEDFEKLYGSRMRELQNGFQAIQRINTRLQQELEQVKRTPAAMPSTSVSATDPWTTIQDGPVWKAEIERLAEQKAKTLLEQQVALRTQQEELTKQDTIREQLKQDVMMRYPDLGPDGDAHSQVSTLFNEVLNEHPDYLKSPFGPKLAMVDMKAKFQSLGIADPDTTLHLTPGTNQELARRTRVAATSTTPARTTLPTSTKVTLTKDDMEFVNYHKLDPVTYAKNKQVMESTGTVEVS